MSELQVPPHDLEAEGAVLSALMVTGTVGMVAEVLRPEMFYAERHRRIYEAILDLAGEGSPVDVVQVATRLRARGRLEQVGGAEYLHEVLDRAASLAHVGAYAQTVRERWRRREMIALCQRSASEAYHTKDGTDAIGGRLVDGMGALSRGAGKDRLVHISTAVREVFEGLKASAARGQRAGLAIGLAGLDEMLGGLYPGEVTVIAARPGMGKSALAFGACAAVASRSPEEGGGGSLAISLEMPSAQVAGRLVAGRAGIPLQVVRSGQMAKSQWDTLTSSAQAVSRLLYWVDDTPGITTSGIRDRVTRTARECEKRATALRLVVIDYAQLARGATQMRGQNRENEVSEISRTVKEIAKEAGCPIILLSQLNRDVEKRGDKRPGLADLRESGALEQDADNVVFIYRDDYYTAESRWKGVAELIVGKARNGATGTTFAGWDGPATRFFDLDDAKLNELERAS